MRTERDAEHEASTIDARPRSRTGPAEVVATRGPRGAQVRFEDGAPQDAQLALPGYDDPRPGDRVLVTVDDAGRGWIVGVIAAPRTMLDEALEAEAPAVQRVHDAEGRLLFEYDAATNRATLHVPEGDLELSAPEGAVSIAARDGFAVDTDGDVTVRGGRSVELRAARGEGAVARLAMQPGELSLGASVLTAAADRAELLATRVGVKATRLETTVERARHAVKVVETRAGRIVERAKETYRETEGLAQTRAGRLRLVAKKAASLVGENTLLKARDRMKVRGERIHLA